MSIRGEFRFLRARRVRQTRPVTLPPALRAVITPWCCAGATGASQATLPVLRSRGLHSNCLRSRGSIGQDCHPRRRAGVTVAMTLSPLSCRSWPTVMLAGVLQARVDQMEAWCVAHARALVRTASDEEVRLLDTDAGAVHIEHVKFPRSTESGKLAIPKCLRTGQCYDDGSGGAPAPAMTVAEQLDAITVLDAFKATNQKNGTKKDYLYWMNFSATVASRDPRRPFRAWRVWKEKMKALKKQCNVCAVSARVASGLVSLCCIMCACAAGHACEGAQQDWCTDSHLRGWNIRRRSIPEHLRYPGQHRGEAP